MPPQPSQQRLDHCWAGWTAPRTNGPQQQRMDRRSIQWTGGRRRSRGLLRMCRHTRPLQHAAADLRATVGPLLAWLDCHMNDWTAAATDGPPPHRKDRRRRRARGLLLMCGACPAGAGKLRQPSGYQLDHFWDGWTAAATNGPPHERMDRRRIGWTGAGGRAVGCCCAGHATRLQQASLALWATIGPVLAWLDCPTTIGLPQQRMDQRRIEKTGGGGRGVGC